MRKSRLIFLVIFVFLLAFPASTIAQTYNVAIGDLPGIEQYIDLIMTMGKVMNVNIEITKVPMPRMVYMLESKKADIGGPMLAIKNEEVIKMLPFDYATGRLGDGICFVLYTNKAKPIDVESLKKGNPNNYKIESDPTNSNFITFQTIPSTNAESSLKKVDAGRIDGYIIAQIVGDPVTKGLGLKNIHRQFYEVFDSIFAIQKGEKGGAVDKFITAAVEKIKKDKELSAIFVGPAIEATAYVDWQP